MIPKQAIEKAIEGGWKFRGYDFDIKFLVKKYPYHIALDRSFWQALGKALGWGEKRYKQSVVATLIRGGNHRAHIRMQRKPTPNRWKKEALRFYDLILTGGDTEKFWAELLANKQEA